ncbi:phosphatase PAP2 family protein [Streptomyces sp. NBC_01016]|uniref:phosphatase PAP2 family protein n=1 Tax=Streptomyces sp. NBC_01016 TaxID=2903720 RepID=UPI002255C2A4|nr:phosphatase PAP2 family protein [Streptomyces sp. NBC_01016]MCX4830628.1 phosphatase PAP2 family protein [Streptomyces sp. NBC_01016]
MNGNMREPEQHAVRPPLIRELLLVVGLFLVYKLGRQLANGHTAEAFHNADHVWSFERAVHLPGEGAVQDALLSSDTLVHAANIYYASVHFPATIALLVFLYLRRPRHYLWTRRVLAVLTAAALVLHLTFPLAPPRMLGAAHLVDTAQVYGPSVYAAKPATDTMANQFAAMPSLHFGWALMVAIGLVAATRSRWRWLWLLHPLFTLLVIVGTANHYWLDTIVATLLLGAALAVIRLPRAVDATGFWRHLFPVPAPTTATAPHIMETRHTPTPWTPAPAAFRTPPDALTAADVLAAATPTHIPFQVITAPDSASASASNASQPTASLATGAAR